MDDDAIDAFLHDDGEAADAFHGDVSPQEFINQTYGDGEAADN